MENILQEKITEWLMGPETCYLLGAGCSVCAGKPLIGGLTDKAMEKAEGELLQQFKNLRQIGDRQPTIEDLINFLVRYRDILEATTNENAHGLSIENIERWLTEIKREIVNAVADDWESSPQHERFLSRLSMQKRRGPLDIFSLNYDTLLEASLDALRLPYTDGFWGTNRAWFDERSFAETGEGKSCRIFKLHGSVNWIRDASGYVRRVPAANGNTLEEPIVIYPSEQKYLQTQFGVYETLMGRFRGRLRMVEKKNSFLIVLGYSFNDLHINEAICDAVNVKGSNLTVVAFVGPEEEKDRQRQRLDKFNDLCDNRFNAFIGCGCTGSFIGNAVEQSEAQPFLEAELWKFENLSMLIAGEPT